MNKIGKIRRKTALFLINHIFSGTHFFGIKRKLMNFGLMKCGISTSVVGPIYIGTEAKLSIGSSTWLGRDFQVLGNGIVEIGDCVDIAPSVYCITGSHKISDNPQRRAGDGLSYHIRIGNGCWIGARSSILGDTTVSDGCVIGASALVTKNTESDGIYAGIPAKCRRQLINKQDNR